MGGIFARGHLLPAAIWIAALIAAPAAIVSGIMGWWP